ncbi:uncharacterized protein LOC128198730 [Bicyclus anynana]|uniref:Uncharacterized protein LOC128198730 n=1 Tax=Bicyclus anynana TaxID=110368 RepID=A0ABM3LQS7_BICAN|nr:uncharacterized protein LOC128198730 [Bicyclus anynana]
MVSERWGPTEARAAEEAALEARVRSTRSLWNQPSQRRPPRAPSPPPVSRKMRARRRQPKRLTLAPPPPAYCLEAPTQLFCDPSCKFQFDSPRSQLTEYQKAMGRLSASVQAVMRANACRCPPYRGTNVSRYAPTGQRPFRYPDRRYGIWWPRENLSPRLENIFNITQIQNITTSHKIEKTTPKIELQIKKEQPEYASSDEQPKKEPQVQQEATPESPSQQKDKVVVDSQTPSTSAAATENMSKKRLYSTVLSMSPPPPINLNTVGCLRLSQKLPPGLIKLNPKLVLSSRVRPNVDNKFEELEKEALEQYKASDESIDTKFRALEEEAVDQYSTSNSNTSCSSGNSGEKKPDKSPPVNKSKVKPQPSKCHKDKSVDSVVIYSQNFPDINAKGNTNSVTNLKNYHTPPRGEKKEQTHRSSKSMRNSKIESQRPASDTDYEARESKGSHKGAMRWTLHVMPPKKRHLTSCASDFSSDEDLKDGKVSIRDAGPCIKNRATGKIKLSAHGAGDLHPIMRKT